MKSQTTGRFWKLFDALPVEVQDQARTGYRLWSKDTLAQFTEVQESRRQHPLYSVRVGLGYRAVGKREGDTIKWFWIGSHADYDRLLG